MSSKDPKTDRELLLTVVVRLDQVSESMERIAAALEKLENNKIATIDKRVLQLEEWRAEWNGVWKFVSIAGVVIGLISILLKWI